MLKTFRLWLWVAVAALGLTALVGAWLLRQPETTSSFGGGVYSVLDQNGQKIDQTMFQGHPSMLFFGYTHCPDVCPTTMAEMAAWFGELGDEGKALHAYFVTVDPERDTPAIMGDYVNWVSDRITGVTGDPVEIAKMLKAWGIFSEKVPLGGDDYAMDHTASVFLLNNKGEFEGTIAFRENTATAVGKLRNLLAKS
ncbi:MAG TPA: SCO family protein [Devosia sp.]|nr:SCO family protein [Devosia sp.]